MFPASVSVKSGDLCLTLFEISTQNSNTNMPYQNDFYQLKVKKVPDIYIKSV